MLLSFSDTYTAATFFVETPHRLLTKEEIAQLLFTQPKAEVEEELGFRYIEENEKTGKQEKATNEQVRVLAFVFLFFVFLLALKKIYSS